MRKLRYPALHDFKRAVQPDRHLIAEQLSIPLDRERTTTQRDHRTISRRNQPPQRLGLDPPKLRLPAFRENVADLRTFRRFDLGVEVHKPPAEFCRQGATDGALPCPHETDYENRLHAAPFMAAIFDSTMLGKSRIATTSSQP